MSATMIPRSLQASTGSTSGRGPLQAIPLPRVADRSLGARRFGDIPKLVPHRLRSETLTRAGKEDRKAEPSTPPSSLESSTDVSPFFEPLLRGLVLGIGAGIICEMLHVAFKFTNIATDGGTHWPSVAQLYEQLAPLIVWDHAVAISFWLLFYTIEAGVILAILREYPDDLQASRVIRSTPTLPKRLMPLKLSSVKRAIFALINGRSPQAVPQSAARLAASTATLPRPTALGGGGSRAAAAVLDAPRPVKKPSPESESDAEEGPASKAEKLAGGAVDASLRKAAGLRRGQMDPAKEILSKSAKREKELQDRRAYLQNFWYAAALSDKVTSTPTKVDILSRTVTLWRGEDGQVYCLDDICPHRGAPLSGGWTTEKNGKSCVVCPYHGWAFNGEGALEEVPSQRPDVSFPRRPLVNSYPVQERGGFVWLFFGSKSLPEDERPPVPMIPELEDPNWRAVYGEMEFNSPHWSVFDNAMDMAHIHYIHSGSFGNQDNPVIRDMKVARDTWSVTANFSIHNKPVSPLWNWTKVPIVPVIARASLPSTSYVKITLGAGVQMITYVNTVPIDEHRSINRFCLIRNFALSPMFDDYTRKSMFKILGEDKAILELLKPEQMAAEVSLEADRPQIAFRKLRQEWIDMGYGVQPEQIAKHSGSLNADM